MMPDEFEAHKMWPAEERRWAPRADLPILAGISKDLGFKCIDQAIRSRSSASFLNASDSRVCRRPLFCFAIAG
jgi:hypothetical protein